jgi:formylglycine-generating enzyme required for sulfatase activity
MKTVCAGLWVWPTVTLAVAVWSTAVVAQEIVKELKLDLGEGVVMETVLIRPGKFLMGSEKSGFENEKPVKEIAISRPFYLGIHLVTQEQWRRLMGTNPSRFVGAKYPVDRVKWGKAREFCRLLSTQLGQTVRLPTEAEWEFSCRAGSRMEYSYGDNEGSLGDYAWYDGNSNHTTHPVGQKKPNAWGLYDMHGNVWQWCQDHYDSKYYSVGPRVDPPGPARSPLQAHVLRGGAWHVEAAYCRSACRGGDFPCGEGGPGSWADAGCTGFRVVVETTGAVDRQ